MKRISNTRHVHGRTTHVVERDGVTIGWIHEGAWIWVDRVGEGLTFDQPRYASVAEALEAV